MKKMAAFLLALLMTCCQLTALAQEDVAPAYDHLVVGHTTAFSGNFSTQMWGNNTTDLDVKELLFGYNLVEWEDEQGVFNVDPTVVTGIIVYDDEDGNRTYTMALDEDLLYSDGSRITAWDYAFTVLLATAPEIAQIGGNTNGYGSLLGIDAYRNGQSDVLEGVKVISDTMISFTVAAEYRPFFYELGALRCYALPISVIAPGCAVKDDGNGVYLDKSAGTFTAEALRKTMLDPETGYMSHPGVTSGPYRLVSYDGAVAEFEINEYYKGNSHGVLPTIPRLTYKTVSNETMIDQLLSGEIGLLNKVVNAESITQGIGGIGSGAVGMSTYARIGYSFISYCCERAAVSSQAVRQAIAYCMDKDTLVNDYVGSFGLRVDGYYGIGQWMYQLVNGTIEPPVEEPAESASQDEKLAYEEAMLAWDELSLDDVPVYELDLEKAAELLDKDGWNLNREGGAYDPAADDVRCASVDGQIIPLELKMIYPEGNTIADSLQTSLIDNLLQVGVKVTMTPVPMAQLLEMYYRQVERDCDMIYLATNFDEVFDPTLNYVPAQGDVVGSNYQAIEAPELYQLALDMSMTEPGDVLTYCQKWIAFQKAWAETLPAIPVYSNAYFDFYTSTLQNYLISSSATWSQAIVEAYLGDPAEETEELELGEDEVIFED